MFCQEPCWRAKNATGYFHHQVHMYSSCGFLVSQGCHEEDALLFHVCTGGTRQVCREPIHHHHLFCSRRVGRSRKSFKRLAVVHDCHSMSIFCPCSQFYSETGTSINDERNKPTKLQPNSWCRRTIGFCQHCHS